MPSSVARTEALPLVPAEPQSLAITPLSILQAAVEKGAQIDTIERLVKLQENMLAAQAEREFSDALGRAQAKIVRVAADSDNPQTHSRYASYAALDRALRPIYTQEGLSLSFNTDQSPFPDYVRVVCLVSGYGHTRNYHIDMPADGKGAKGGDVMTRTHATGAATSYGMRYLLKMIFNVAIGEDDRDGNSLQVPEEQLLERITWIEDAKDLPFLQKAFAEAYRWAQGIGDKNAMGQLIKAKDERKRALNAAH